ncbi:MAG: branched-chain amino acid ABC transporter substrate-binding protein [Phototrophicaceae bacterium]
MKRILLLLTILALLAVSVAMVSAQDCADELGCVVLESDDPVTIAYMLALSGAVAPYGEDSKGAIEIAVDDRGGMILDREIELVAEDELCSAEGGQAAAQKVAADDMIVAVIGTTCSGAATGALPIISEAGLVLISPANTSPFLTSPDTENNGVWQPGYYRTGHNDLIQGRIAAEYAFNGLGLTKLATIHDGDAYTDGLQQAMADAFAALGGEVVFQGAVNKGDTDMTAILTEVAASGAEVLYFPLFEPEGPFIVSQVGTTDGLEEIVLFGADGLFTNTFAPSAGERAAGMYMSSPRVTGERYDELLQKWEDKFGGTPPSGFHAHAYDATNMVLDAIEAVAVTNDDGTVVIGRQALRDALTNTENYDGITGSLTCTEYGDCATGEALAIYQLGEAQVAGEWPPAVVWSPADAE